MPKKKFMQTLDPRIFRELKNLARERGINVQELISVELVPSFLYGPISFDKKTLRRWSKIWNGSTRKILGKRRMSRRA